MFYKHLIIGMLILMSCDTGKLHVVADIPNHLTEVSAVEITSKSDLIWVIEDGGNDNHLYGLNHKGNIEKDLVVLHSENDDWEDLTSDDEGNVYIGDFGNNSKKRDVFTIYKVPNPAEAEGKLMAEKINFTLPKNKKSEDFEAFFIYDKSFYIFSKESKNCVMLRVPNLVGNHTAEVVSEFNLTGKHNRITSADISEDGKTVVLLNHEKIWKLSSFTSDNFLEGKIVALHFEHSSQKEGVCFKTDDTIYLTDENRSTMGNNIYSFYMD